MQYSTEQLYRHLKLAIRPCSSRGLTGFGIHSGKFIVPKDALISGAKAAGRTDIRVSWPKAKLADYFLSQVPFEIAAEHCGAAGFIALGDVQPLEFLLYLYFGKTESDLKNFALRDLGIMRTNKATSRPWVREIPS